MGNEKQPSKISPIDELAKQFVPKRKPRMATRSVTLPVRVLGTRLPVRVSIPSPRLSQGNRQASIQGFETQILFSEFSETELARLTAELGFGEDSSLAPIEEERVA